MNQRSRRPTWLGTLIVIVAVAALALSAARRLRRATRPPQAAPAGVEEQGSPPDPSARP